MELCRSLAAVVGRMAERFGSTVTVQRVGSATVRTASALTRHVQGAESMKLDALGAVNLAEVHPHVFVFAPGFDITSQDEVTFAGEVFRIVNVDETEMQGSAAARNALGVLVRKSA